MGHRMLTLIHVFFPTDNVKQKYVVEQRRTRRGVRRWVADEVAGVEVTMACLNVPLFHFVKIN